MIRRAVFGSLALLALSVWAPTASAQIFGGPGGYGFGFFNYSDSSYQRPPFYAMFPPVYYSLPVPRTYGYSPFAYPPGTMTPELVEPPTGAIYRNPFVPQRDGEAQPTADKTARAARTYINPFVQAARAKAAAAEKLARHSGS